MLIQAGLLNPDGLPIVGAEQSQALVDQTRPKNELITTP